MPVIKQNIRKGQLVPLLFTQDAVAPSQTDVQMNIIETGATSGTLSSEEYYALWPGEIVGITYDLSAAASAGTLTVGATIDGTEDSDTTQTITTAQRGGAKVARGKVTFTAGKYLGVELTTDASWNGTTSDLVVVLWVLFYLEGI